MEILKRDFDEQKVSNDFDQTIAYYDLWSKLTESRAINKGIELAEIKNGEKILEVAVGTGLAFKLIVNLNPGGKNIGLDISRLMLKKAEKNMKDVPVDQYKLETGNAYHLQFDNDSFDLLINNFMLDLLPEKDFEIILKEFYRVLKPGGRIVISSFSFGTKKIHKMWNWIAEKTPNLLKGCRPISLIGYLERTGFKIHQTEQISQNTFPSQVLKAVKPT